MSLEIADGEFMILVGPSGSGKSTLLRMIVGLEDITSGEMRIGGKRMDEKAPRERNLAMVFQNYALYPHLTVFENIAFPLRLPKGGDDEIRRKVEEAAGVLELAEHLERKPSQLSGGQRQRVAMGRAIVREADAFLFDEPLSNLDAKLRGQMRTEIARLQQRLGVTTVYVTHDQIEAMTLGDRVAVLRKGVLQQVDTPRELYERPVNIFVAGFIGSPPMNLLPAAAFPVVSLDCLSDEGRDLVVGIRPEHLEDEALVDPAVRDHGIAFEVEVEAVESLGPSNSSTSPGRRRGNSSNRSSVSPPNWIGSRPVSGWWRGSTRGAPSPGERRHGCGSTPPTCTCSMRGRVNGSGSPRLGGACAGASRHCGAMSPLPRRCGPPPSSSSER